MNHLQQFRDAITVWNDLPEMNRANKQKLVKSEALSENVRAIRAYYPNLTTLNCSFTRQRWTNYPKIFAKQSVIRKELAPREDFSKFNIYLKTPSHTKLCQDKTKAPSSPNQ